MRKKIKEQTEENNFYNLLDLISDNNDAKYEIRAFIEKKIVSGQIDKFFRCNLFLNRSINKGKLLDNRIYFLVHLKEHYFEKLNYATKKEVLNSLASMKNFNKDFNEALELIKTYKTLFKERDDIPYAVCLNITGMVNSSLNNKKLALKVFYNALNILNKNKDNHVNQNLSININNNIALIYRNQNEYDSAIKIIKQNILLQEQLGLRLDISSSYMNIGSVFSFKKDYQKAIDYSLKAQKIKYDLGDTFLANKINLNLANFYYELAQLDLAEEYANKCLASDDEKIQKLISGIILSLELENYKKSENLTEDKTKLAKQANICLSNINDLNNDTYKIAYYSIIAEALEISGNSKMAIDLLNKKFVLYKKKNELEKESTYKNLRKSHEIQLQQKEIEQKEFLLLQKEETNQKLQQVNKDLEQFTAMATHDLKSPLRNISTFCKLIEDEGTITEEQKEYTNLIKTDTKKMSMLINSLLKYAKIGFNEIEMETIDLNRLVNSVLKNLNQQIKSKNAVVNIKVLPVIQGNAILLQQLFQNLINNALKYNENQKPEITIRSIETENTIEIIDNGIGIPENKIEDIFKAFTRAHSVNKYEGSGVGLATCKKIMNIHSGTIAVSSEVGKGSCFSLVGL